jgi:hypothetical protein
LGVAFVAGRNRVPRPATGKIAVFTCAAIRECSLAVAVPQHQLTSCGEKSKNDTRMSQMLSGCYILRHARTPFRHLAVRKAASDRQNDRKNVFLLLQH